jgi:hypothetical protein
MAIASSDRRLGGSVTKGAPEPDGTTPLQWLPVETLSPTCRPPPGGCLWSRRARRAGPCSGRCPWSRHARRGLPPFGRLRLRLRLHRRCRVQRLACTPCRVVEVLHHRAMLLLHRLGHGRGSRQLCTVDLVGAAAQQVGQRKLQRWCVATVVVNRSRRLEQWLLLNRCLKH